MSNLTTYPDIPMNLLAHLLDRAGTAGEISPRRLWQAAAPDPRQAEELTRAGITTTSDADAPLTANFDAIARTLMNPATNLTFRAWGDSHSAIESNLQFPGKMRDGHGVALNQTNGRFRISAGFDASDILNQLAPLLPAVPDSEPTLPLEAHLPMPVATALLAVLDLTRGLEFPEGPYAAADINGYIQGQWGLTGFDKFLSYLPALGVSTQPPGQTAVAAALETLASLAYLDEVRSGYFALGPELTPLADRMRGEMPGLQWQRLHTGQDGALWTANRIWLYGTQGLILMLAPMSDSSVFIRSVRPDAIMAFVSSELAGAGTMAGDAAGAPATHEQAASPAPCSACGAANAPEAKFCMACGANLRQPKGLPASRKKIQPPPTQNLAEPVTRFPLGRAALLMGSVASLFMAAVLTAYFLASPKQPVPPWHASAKAAADRAPDAAKEKTSNNADIRPKPDQPATAKAFRKAGKPTQKSPEAKALYARAEDYYRGRNGVEKDDAQAMSFYRRAADRGYAAAQSSLGYMYATGQGVEKDHGQGFDWTQKAANQGYAEAQRNLAIMYKKGWGVAKNLTTAVTWYRKAAEQGHDKAQYDLAQLYFKGEAIPRDDAKALKWFRRSADQGNKQAQTNLGVMYYNGQGVGQSYRTALEWFRKAAEQGHPTAQFNVGFMTEKGHGVAEDRAAAIGWYRKAAGQGYASARERLKALGADD
jgi:TPR repeat protein